MLFLRAFPSYLNAMKRHVLFLLFTVGTLGDFYPVQYPLIHYPSVFVSEEEANNTLQLTASH